MVGEMPTPDISMLKEFFQMKMTSVVPRLGARANMALSVKIPVLE
jgi:hypothetical protein